MLDRFCDTMIEIAKKAESDPEAIKRCPLNMPIGRLDEAALRGSRCLSRQILLLTTEGGEPDTMEMRGRKLLFISQKAGFFGGVERYIFQIAALLRGQGVELWGAFAEMARDSERFRTGFDRLLSPWELLTVEQDFALVGVHKLDDNALLQELLERYGAQLALFVHDHDVYCPRSHKYFPFTRRNCRLPYARLRCGCCGMAVSPRRWSGGLSGEMREKFTLFPERLSTIGSSPI